MEIWKRSTFASVQESTRYKKSHNKNHTSQQKHLQWHKPDLKNDFGQSRPTQVAQRTNNFKQRTKREKKTRLILSLRDCELSIKVNQNN